MSNEDPPEPQSPRYFSLFEKHGYYCDDYIHLDAGGPGTELLRMLPPIIEAATNHCMQNELEGDAQLFQYGLENGNWQFRSFLATFLSKEYGDTVNCEQIFQTGGATSGLWLISSALLAPGSTVFVENPTYFCAISVFHDLHLNVVTVKTDDQGLVVEDLIEKLIQHFSNDPTPAVPPVRALLYLITVFHNPTGTTLPEERCRQLIKLSRKYGLLVVCDDVYNLLHYDDAPFCPKRLFAFDNQSDKDYTGNVISNGTFSKILGPGMRIGWLEAPKWAVEKLIKFPVIISGGGLTTFTAGIITSLLALEKMKTHLQKVKTIYQTRMEATAGLLREELPEGCKLKSPATGGYFLWIELPEDINAEHFLLFSSHEYKLKFQPGIRSSASSSFSNYIRLCISFYSLDILLSSARSLCQAISDFRSKNQENPDFWKIYQT